jgi:LPXTG-motif cell wall-anchored protein
MDAGVIVAIVVGALLLIGLIAWLGTRRRERRLEAKRIQAGEIRREAQIEGARAKREEAAAEEHAARAGRQQRFARERREEADQLDPDVEGTEYAERERR